MAIVEINQFESEIVLFFQTKEKRINVYTLASTLVSIADAAREANSIVNPGYDIEVVVTVLADGSFKAVLKTIYNNCSNLFSKQSLQAIILGIISTYIYEHTLAPNNDIKIFVDQENVIIEQNDNKIIVPKDIYEAKRLVEKSDRFKESISRTFSTLDKDRQIDGFAFTKDISEVPVCIIPRDNFSIMEDLTEDDDERAIVQHTHLQILRAILDKTNRKWEFVMGGIKIPAPVLDEVFYKDFYDHKITIAPGDLLECDLKMYQKKETMAGIYTNYKYEVIKVTRHISKDENINLFQ